jgi:hypothetical protein
MLNFKIMYGVEEYYNDLIMEAKSPEEIKQILVRKFVDGRGVPEDVLDRIFAIDPTKKKTYTSWVLNFWITDAFRIQEALDNGTLQILFHYFKTRNNEGLNLVAIPSLQEAIDMLPEIDTTLEKMSNGGEEDNFDIVYDTPEWKIAVPHSYPASEKLGKGCKWCTAGWWEGRGPYYWTHYTAFGPLWINFDYSTPQEDKLHKQHQFTRYQFLFEYDNYRGEFMDYDDKRVEPSQIPTMPMAVKEFYVSQNPRYRNAVMGGNEQHQERQNRHQEYLQERLQDALVLKEFANGVKLMLIQELNRNDTLETNAPYHIYISEDTNDPITHDNFPKSMNIVSNTCGNYPMIIIKNSNNGMPDTAYIKVSHGFDTHNIDVLDIKNNGDYVVIKKKGGYNNQETYETLIATDVDSKFLTIPKQMTCLGRKKDVVDVFRNKNLEGGNSNMPYIEIALDNGFHLLYRKRHNAPDYAFILSNMPYGEDRYTMVNGLIRGKYGIFNPYNGTNYSTYELINDNFAIVKMEGLFNVFDSLRGELIGDTWFNQILNLYKDNLVFACSAANLQDNLIISLNTKKYEEIQDLHSARQQEYSLSYVGLMFNGNVEVKIPFSFRGVSFNPIDQQGEAALRDFIGESYSEINEEFKKFYNRMIKK